MNAYCPECETELDQATGICPACRWDPIVAQNVAAPLQEEPEMSLTERYRGTNYDISAVELIDEGPSVPKARAFVLVALIAGAGVYGLLISSLGVL